LMSAASLLLVASLFSQSAQTVPEAEYLVVTSVRVSSTGGGVIRASVPVPREWPEQRIELAKAETVRCKIKVEPMPPGCGTLVVVTFNLRPGEVASVDYRQQLFVKPQPRRRRDDYQNLPVLDAKSKPFVLPTPTIDSNDPAIKRKAKEICEGIDSPWEKARRLSDWTFNHLEYKLMAYTSAKAALESKIGDCEERSALFAALCRSQGIPARIVVGPGKKRSDSGHCWTEIMLADRDGNAEWLPVDVGLRWFGELPIAPPVIQKGDSYPRPGSTGLRQRLAGSWAKAGNGQLTFEWEQEVTPISANAILDPTQIQKPAKQPSN
jgi:hypothetical protein